MFGLEDFADVGEVEDALLREVRRKCKSKTGEGLAGMVTNTTQLHVLNIDSCVTTRLKLLNYRQKS